MTGFIITAAVGFLMLLVSLIFDGLLDSVDMDFSGSGIFSGASLGGFLTGMGCGGIIGTAQGWDTIPALALGLGIGVAMAGVAIALYRALKNAEVPDEAFALDQMVGTTGIITAGSSAGSRGLVQVTYLGSPRTISAIAAVDVTSGEAVTVTSILGPDIVQVAPLHTTYDPVPPIYGRY
ncbi:MAG: hypothetical protein LBN10_12515 [Propionibacteriaceae bacterium]|jgi:hypothetical protein|nr:hypothetical protein [Propionibacteriaceae bacterium]